MPDLLDECKQRDYHWDLVKSLRSRDYADARISAKRSRRHVTRGYDDALHIARTLTSRRRDEKVGLEHAFRAQVDRWKDETGHLSSLTKAIAHPSYLRIIGLATESTRAQIERLLLKELQSEPDHWFPALAAISGEDPVHPDDDFDAAVVAWLKWGEAKGLL